ncbi:Lrp/AsnC family transcriptional regulator [Pseudorhodobacter turbinis]|uniref:Lrp/AsnC family transcriptional regulator n=1 Tax=Pseudorhodobacter turbinis TaxID=2500533 RepID=A0A4P8EFQ3_9RHOB|nr:Lrp/AsnC family transcriptional regulator [Pseudorhodobacter turbinis]QCO55305.1 Lrp/AsnC family transcriptional regulator [Pseudorhodobacter turbinis]
MDTVKLDQIDRALLRALQRDASQSQRELAEVVGLSQNACWRRLKVLHESGLILGQTLRLDAQRAGLGLTVFVMVRTRHHSGDWLAIFRREVLNIPHVIDFYRIAGDYDYMLKVVAEDMNAFDQIYQRLTARVELETVSSYITMEAIADARDLPV